MSFLEAQQEILLDRVASVVENKIVLMSDVVLAANCLLYTSPSPRDCT